MTSAEQDRRDQTKHSIAYAMIGANVGGLLILEFYLLIDSWIRGAWAPFLSYTALALLAASLQNYLAYQRTLRPIWSWYIASTSSALPSLQVQKQAFHLTWTLARSAFGVWASVGLITAIIFWPQLNTAYAASNTITALSFIGLASPMVTTYTYLALYRVWRPELPRLFKGKPPEELFSFQLTLRRQLIVLLALGLLPLLLMVLEGYEHITYAHAASSFLYKSIYFLVIWGLMTFVPVIVLYEEFARSIQMLREKVRDVGAGKLDIQLSISSGDELGQLMSDFNSMVVGLRREKVTHALFGRYSPPEAIDQVIQNSAGPGGQSVNTTVLCARIHKFTSLTRQMDANTLIAMLNRYFAALSPVIFEHGGALHEFSGDYLLAIFGPPISSQDDHPTYAVRAAAGMHFALDAFNAEQRERDEPRVHIGIGIATGSLITGNLGSKDTPDYIIMGETVNLAKYLQTLTEEVAAEVLLSEGTAREVQFWATLRYIDQFTTRNQETPVPVFSLGEPHQQTT